MENELVIVIEEDFEEYRCTCNAKTEALPNMQINIASTPVFIMSFLLLYLLKTLAMPNDEDESDECST